MIRTVPSEIPQCPRCRLPLRPMTHAGVKVDVCVECCGLWGNSGELEQLLGPGGGAGLVGRLAYAPSQEIRYGCPQGHGPLRRGTPGHGVVVDWCPACAGVWVDRGELARLQPLLAPDAPEARERIATLELRVDEARRQADEHRIPAIEERVRSGRRHWLFQFFFGLPVEVHSHVRNRPLVTYGLIAANIVVFLLQLASPDGLIDRFALVPAEFVHRVAPWTLFTSMFMHGGLVHIFGNMYFLRVFGDNVEDWLGRAEYLGLYLLGGMAASFAHIASDPSSPIPVIGASGAVSAVMGAYLYLFPHRRIYTMFFFKLVRLRAVWYFGIYLFFQLYNAALGVPGVAWWAHIGGFVLGVAAAALHRGMVRRRLAALERASGGP